MKKQHYYQNCDDKVISVNIPTFIVNETPVQDLKSSGGNFGNIIFWHAVHKFLKDSNLKQIQPTWPEADNIETGIKPYKYLDIQANLIDERKATKDLPSYSSIGQIRYNINVVNKVNADEKHLLSIGAQNQTNDIMELSNEYRDTLSNYLSMFKTVNLRGEYTKQVLEHNDIKHPNLYVNGCPSAYLLKDLTLGTNGFPTINEEPKVFQPIIDTATANIIITSLTNFKQAADDKFLWNLVLEFRKHDQVEILSQVPNGTETLPYTTSYDGWIKTLSKGDIVIGTRIHGSICALAANRPCICIAIDSRTLELCKKLSIPHIDYTNLKVRNAFMSSIQTVEDLIEYINLYYKTNNIRIDKIQSTGSAMESYLKQATH